MPFSKRFITLSRHTKTIERNVSHYRCNRKLATFKINGTKSHAKTLKARSSQRGIEKG